MRDKINKNHLMDKKKRLGQVGAASGYLKKYLTAR
jgi:hypothetical protein